MNTEPSTDPAPLPGALPPATPGGGSGDFAALEEIRGPVFGYYVAAYTIERPEGFFAFAKICRQEPASVWETPDARAILSVGPEPVASIALEAAFRSVYKRLSVKRWNLPTMPVDLPDTLPKPPTDD